MKKIVEITKKIGTSSVGLEAITTYECLCGCGTIEYHIVPGFDDDWFEIKCKDCKKTISYMGWNTPHEWLIYLK